MFIEEIIRNLILIAVFFQEGWGKKEVDRAGI